MRGIAQRGAALLQPGLLRLGGEERPEDQVPEPEGPGTVLYRDMRMYGHLEEHYARARHAGVLFLRYEEDRKPVVNQKDGNLELSFYNPVLREE